MRRSRTIRYYLDLELRASCHSGEGFARFGSKYKCRRFCPRGKAANSSRSDGPSAESCWLSVMVERGYRVRKLWVHRQLSERRGVLCVRCRGNRTIVRNEGASPPGFMRLQPRVDEIETYVWYKGGGNRAEGGRGSWHRSRRKSSRKSCPGVTALSRPHLLHRSLAVEA